MTFERELFRALTMALLMVWGILAFIGSAHAGECVGAMDAPTIIRTLSGVHPDSLTHEARYMLGCLERGVSELKLRSAHLPPSWRLLRNTRREYRQLGNNAELVQTLVRLRSSRGITVRSWVIDALALYGLPVNPDSIPVATADLPQRAMLLAVLGDSTGVRVAIDGYSSSADSRERFMLLDALYYQCTSAAAVFIERVAADSTDAAASERARWMLEHPFLQEASWSI